MTVTVVDSEQRATPAGAEEGPPRRTMARLGTAGGREEWEERDAGEGRGMRGGMHGREEWEGRDAGRLVDRKHGGRDEND